MLTQAVARKVIRWVGEGSRTLKEGVEYLAKVCSCGSFDAAAAQRILERVRRGED